MLRRVAQGIVAVGAFALFAFAWRCDGPWFDRHVFLPQQFFVIASRHIVFWSRATAAALALLLVFLAVRTRRAASARRLLLAVLLAVATTESLLQWRLHRLLDPGLADATHTLAAWDARYGATLRGSIDGVYLMSGREIYFRTDAEGRRFSGAPIDPALPSLVFTGESTVAGVGLQWQETFPAILGARLHLQVVNLASPGYRIDQSWLRLGNELPKLDHPVAVIGLFMPGLVGRSFAGQQHPPARPSPTGGVELVPVDNAEILQRSGLYRLWKHLYWSDAAVEEGMRSVSAVLRDIAALAKARSAPCIFVVTGATPQSMIHDLFEVPGLDYVVVDVPEGELLPDSHPGPLASVRLAGAVETMLRARIANW